MSLGSFSDLGNSDVQEGPGSRTHAGEQTWEKWAASRASYITLMIRLTVVLQKRHKWWCKYIDKYLKKATVAPIVTAIVAAAIKATK